MLQLRVLGALSLQRPDGTEVRSVLAQPKRAALLVQLALTARDGLQRRDTLIGLFWPELDEGRARGALSQALHYLRRSLGPDVIVSRGRDLIGVDAGALWCDVVAFEDVLRSGTPDGLRAALDLYRGDLLPGLHLPDAPEFERWLDEQRDRLRRRAADAGFSLADHAATTGQLPEAAREARRALERVGYSEDRLRWTIELLDRAGDGAAAVQLYDHAADQLARVYELQPSPATRELIAAVRARASGGWAVDADATVQARAAQPQATPREPDGADALTTAAGSGAFAPAAHLHVRAPAGPHPRSRWALAGALAALLLIAVVGGRPFVQTWRGPPSQAAPQEADRTLSRVAVLPFANFSADPREAYLADALTAELISRLARLRALRVIARTSVMAYGQATTGVAQIAHELRVGTIVEGGVLTAGDTVRIQVRIVDAASEEPVWSRDYDAPRAELLRVQRQIAEDVAVGLSVEARPLTQRHHALAGADTRAYEDYLRGRSLLGRIDGESLLLARAHFTRATSRDSTLAVAWSGLAQALMQLMAAAVTPAREAVPLARAAAERALRLDGELAEAHAALATIYSNHDWNATDTERHFRRAIELDPSHADAYRAYAGHLRNLGRFTEALALLHQAQDLDPRSPLPVLEEGILQYLARNYDAAQAVAERLLHEHPQSFRAQFLMALVHIETRDFAAALAALDAVDPEWLRPDVNAIRGYVFGRTGRVAEARQALALVLRSAAPTAAFHSALIHIALGEHERALELFEAAADERSPLVRLLAVEPKMDPMRGDPRFESLLRRLGLAPDDHRPSAS